MKPSTPTRLDPKWAIAEFALFLFIFLQLLTGLVEATYAFGLLSVDIPPETIFVLFLLTPLLLLLYPRVLDGRAGQIFTLVTILLAEGCWVASLAQDTRGKMILCGVGVGAGLLALAGLLRRSRAEAASLPGAAPLPFGETLAAASLASIGMRAINSGNDLFMEVDALRTLGIVLLLVFSALRIFRWIFSAPGEQGLPAQPSPSFGRTAALCLGLFSVLTLVYFAFAAPAVIARWTGGSYPWITILTAAPLALLLFAWPNGSRLGSFFTPRALLVWNLLFALALALTLTLYGVRFPSSTVSFPFDQPDPGLAGQIALVVMLLLHPVIYLDFGLLAKTLSEDPPTPRALAGGFSLGALYLTLLIFAHIFTTVYDYVPVIGAWFRDRFALVTVFPAALLVLVMFLLLRGRCVPLAAHRRWGALFYLALLPLASALVIGLAQVPIEPAQEKHTLRILTYNIQQGYNANGQKAFAQQYRVMHDQGADIIGLQESDTARIAGGNSDLVRYLSDRLHMYAYYGPRTTSGTFGIALLSRYPIQDARTFFMFSEGEQTAAIQAHIRVGGKTFTVLVTHLGNDGPLIQQQQVLRRLEGQQNIIAMGDFNFRAGSESYRQSIAALQDGWLSAELQQVRPGDDAGRRIDHIFLSPGTRVPNAAYLPEGPSDHPGMFLEIAWD